MLLRALAALAEAGQDFTMDIAGEDTLGGEIHDLARRLGLASQVRFHGYLPQQRLRVLVQQAHLIMISSRHEAGPLAVLEAAVQGVPTVGTAVGHIADWAPQAAASVAVGDWKALAQAAARLLGDEDLRLRIAREACRRATREDADYTARAFRSIYRELTA